MMQNSVTIELLLMCNVCFTYSGSAASEAAECSGLPVLSTKTLWTAR